MQRRVASKRAGQRRSLASKGVRQRRLTTMQRNAANKRHAKSFTVEIVEGWISSTTPHILAMHRTRRRGGLATQ